MGLLDVFKKKDASPSGRPIATEDQKYYRPDDYYKDVVFADTQFERKVITFDERKRISYKSSGGLYVAEILLLQYCSYGTYPNPKNGYPGFWWYTYGIRNVGAVLESLNERGFVVLDGVKYKLTDKGKRELSENAYVPFMHKHRKKTTEDTRFGPEFNVWSVNRIIGQGDTRDWTVIVSEQEKLLDKSHAPS